jgi:hypothetical protein
MTCMFIPIIIRLMINHWMTVSSIHNDTTAQPSSIHSDQVLKEKAIIELNKCLEEVEVQ